MGDRFGNPYQVLELLNGLPLEHGAVVTIGRGDRSLVICVSDGRYTVAAVLGEDDFFDLIENRELAGTVPFIQGGQLVDLPERELVPHAAVLRVAGEFLDVGTIDVSGACWQRQR